MIATQRQSQIGIKAFEWIDNIGETQIIAVDFKNAVAETDEANRLQGRI